MMGRKAKLYLNGEKLKVEGPQPQCSPQEGNGVKKQVTQPQSSPHKGNGAKENREGAQGGALLSNLLAIVVEQTVLDMAMKGVGQAISIHDKTLEEASKTVWDSMTRMDEAKLILTANATALKTKMTHAEVMGLKEALDEARKELMEVKSEVREARNELMEVKNDLREVKAIVGPPKFPPPSFGGGNGSGSEGRDGSGSGSDDGDGSGSDDGDSNGSDGNGWD